MKTVIALTFTLAAIHMTLAFNSKKSKAVFDRPVEYQLAQECIAKYKASGEIRDVVRTENIEFHRDSLELWIKEVSRVSKFNTIRVYPGLYTKAILRKYGKDPSLENRLTVFFFAYNNGAPATKSAPQKTSDAILKSERQTLVDPFNLGNVHP